MADRVMVSGGSLAEAALGEVIREGAEGMPSGGAVDSREVRPGDLFFGIPGENFDGGEFASQAIANGAWGVVAGREWLDRIEVGDAWLIAVEDPLVSLQRIGRQRRRDLDCRVVGITGSNGKTTVKDICRAIFGDHTHASEQNRNTEIGLPLTILDAPEDTEIMICEMGMRGTGQIAELCEIAEPDVGVITNVGPVHLELLGSIEAIAAAKAEMLAGIKPGGTAVVPAEPGEYLAPHLRGELDPGPAEGVSLLRFGDDGEVFASSIDLSSGHISAEINTPSGAHRFEFPFRGSYNLLNGLAAVSAGIALGLDLAEMARRAPGIVFSRLRGEMIRLQSGSMLINDCYNANPVSMRAALDNLSSLDAERRIAVLGEMLELGPEAKTFHSDTGAHARASGVDLILGVGDMAKSYSPDRWFGTAAEAAEDLAEMIGANDVVLVKGSRSVGLEVIADRLASGGN